MLISQHLSLRSIFLLGLLRPGWWRVNNGVVANAGLVVIDCVLMRLNLLNGLIHYPWRMWEGPRLDRDGSAQRREKTSRSNCEQVLVQMLSGLEKLPSTSRCHSYPNCSLTSHFTFPKQTRADWKTVLKHTQKHFRPMLTLFFHCHHICSTELRVFLNDWRPEGRAGEAGM